MKRTAENKVKAVAAGGIETITNIISIYANDLNTCSAGLDVLFNMTVRNSKRILINAMNVKC